MMHPPYTKKPRTISGAGLFEGVDFVSGLGVASDVLAKPKASGRQRHPGAKETT
jgi:hypothetical protein